MAICVVMHHCITVHCCAVQCKAAQRAVHRACAPFHSPFFFSGRPMRRPTRRTGHKAMRRGLACVVACEFHLD